MSKIKISENTLPIHSDPQIMRGVPVFIGTRVPVQTLFDYLVDGSSVDEFFENFPTVKKDHVMQVLEFASSCILERAVSR
jgi:uncharacterized protein (DUF433 family)